MSALEKLKAKKAQDDLPFTQPWDHGDITFIIEDRKIYANKAVLEMSSEVFKAMFTSEFAEKKMIEIPLPDKKFDDFIELMKVVHPQRLKHLDDSNVHRVLPLAHEYQMKAVLENCCKALSDGAPSIRSLNMAVKYNLELPQLHTKCVQYLKDIHLRRLRREAGFTELAQETLIEILTYKVEKYER